MIKILHTITKEGEPQNLFGPNEYPTEAALKQLVVNELGCGAKITNTSPTSITVQTAASKTCYTETSIEGPEEEMQYLLQVASQVSKARTYNTQELSGLLNSLDRLIQAKSSLPEREKLLPAFFGLWVPIIFGNSYPSASALIGLGKKTDLDRAPTNEEMAAALDKIAKNPKKAWKLRIYPIMPAEA